MVINVVVEVLSPTSVRVSWDRITDESVTGYRVYYSPKGSGQLDERSITLPASESSVVITGLSGGVEYQFQVAAIAEFGGQEVEGERSPITSIATSSGINTQHACTVTYTHV